MNSSEFLSSEKGEEFEVLTPVQLRDRCLSELRKATEEDDILMLKRGVLQFTAYVNPDKLDGLYDVKLIAKNKDKLINGLSCFEYAVGRDVDIKAFYDNMQAYFTKSDEPLPGAYALYLRCGIIPTHIGKVTNERTVISKWGSQGNVYEHEPLMVPFQYGNMVTYFLPPQV